MWLITSIKPFFMIGKNVTKKLKITFFYIYNIKSDMQHDLETMKSCQYKSVLQIVKNKHKHGGIWNKYR